MSECLLPHTIRFLRIYRFSRVLSVHQFKTYFAFSFYLKFVTPVTAAAKTQADYKRKKRSRWIKKKIEEIQEVFDRITKNRCLHIILRYFVWFSLFPLFVISILISFSIWFGISESARNENLTFIYIIYVNINRHGMWTVNIQ